MGRGDRTAIIRAVQTPLGFFTLLALVLEAILAFLVTRVTGTDLTIIVIGFVLLPFVLIGAVIWSYPRALAVERDQDPRNRDYDVFVASVLAGFDNDERLLAERETALAVVGALEKYCNYRVYYAGRNVQSQKDFDRTEIGAKQDIEALRNSRHFIMLYPERLTSSVLFEAGYAYQRCATSTYLVHKKEDLPYLMQRLPEVHATFLRTLTYDSADDIVQMIRDRQKDLFDFPKK